MPKQFPKTLFVKIEEDGDVEYFTADEDAAYLVEMGQKTKVATYQLVEIAVAQGVAQFAAGKKVG